MIGLLGSAMIGIHSYAGDSLKQKGGGAAVTNQAEGIGYSVLLYDATNGLPTSDANVIMSTTDGFIWIGGYSGLICYDGTTLTGRMQEQA